MLRERTDINASETLVQESHQFADPLKTMEDLDPLLERIGEARTGSWEDVLHRVQAWMMNSFYSIKVRFLMPSGSHAATGRLGSSISQNWKATAIMFRPSFRSATTPFHILTKRKLSILYTSSLKK